ncbi:unnamed protein product, partial [Symbiodinium natans]
DIGLRRSHWRSPGLQNVGDRKLLVGARKSSATWCYREGPGSFFHGKQRFLYAWVFEAPVLWDTPAPYKQSPSVRWTVLEAAAPSRSVAAPSSSENELERGVEPRSALVLYNTTLNRAEGMLHVLDVQEFASVQAAEEYVCKQKWYCACMPRGKGPIYVLQVQAESWLQPVPGTLQTRALRPAACNIQTMRSRRPTQSLADTALQGAAPAMSLYASCQHFVDRLCVEDVKKLQANLALLDDWM